MYEHYYNKSKNHDYMDVSKFDIIILDYLKNTIDKSDIVLEIGAGEGRYTHCLASVAGQVIASEPNEHMYSMLSQSTEQADNIQTSNLAIEQLIDNPPKDKVTHIALFHVLHHLPRELYKPLFDLQRKLDAKIIIIEPNHINPLFFLQILLTKDMTWHDEKGMFSDNSGFLTKRYFDSNNFEKTRSYIGFLPPDVTRKVANLLPFVASAQKTKIGFSNPFSAYSTLEISSTV